MFHSSNLSTLKFVPSSAAVLSDTLSHNLQPVPYIHFLLIWNLPPDTIIWQRWWSLHTESNHLVILFAVDRLLYRETVDVQWVYPEQFLNLIRRVGGMHMLMSITDVAGFLMVTVVSKKNWLIRLLVVQRKFPQNLSAMKMAVRELLDKTVECWLCHIYTYHNIVLAVISDMVCTTWDLGGPSR